MINLSIGQLAKQSGISVDTIRYYEKIGLLQTPKRTAGNYRYYSKPMLAELLFLKHCRELGITLQDIKNLEHLKQDLTHLKLQCSQHKTIEQCGILKELHQPLECEHESHQHKKAPPL